MITRQQLFEQRSSAIASAHSDQRYYHENHTRSLIVAFKLLIGLESRETFSSIHLAIEHYVKHLFVVLVYAHLKVTGRSAILTKQRPMNFLHNVKGIIVELNNNISDAPHAEIQNLILKLDIPGRYTWANLRYSDPKSKSLIGIKIKAISLWLSFRRFKKAMEANIT